MFASCAACAACVNAAANGYAAAGRRATCWTTGLDPTTNGRPSDRRPSSAARRILGDWTLNIILNVHGYLLLKATQSLKAHGKVEMDQDAVWEHVEGMLAGANASSPTHAYHAVYDKWHQDIDDYEAQLRVPDDACGVAAEINGRLAAVDLFDKPGTLKKLWPRMVRSYVLAALRPDAALAFARLQ